MSALRSTKVFALLIVSLAILRSVAQNDTDPDRGTTAADGFTDADNAEFNIICQNRAQENGEDVPTDWVWSINDEDCVNSAA